MNRDVKQVTVPCTSITYFAMRIILRPLYVAPTYCVATVSVEDDPYKVGLARYINRYLCNPQVGQHKLMHLAQNVHSPSLKSLFRTQEANQWLMAHELQPLNAVLSAQRSNRAVTDAMITECGLKRAPLHDFLLVSLDHHQHLRSEARTCSPRTHACACTSNTSCIICVHAYMKRTYARTHARLHTPTHARTHARACVPKHAPTLASTHPRTDARTHARTHAPTHACTHAPTNPRTHTILIGCTAA